MSSAARGSVVACALLLPLGCDRKEAPAQAGPVEPTASPPPTAAPPASAAPSAAPAPAYPYADAVQERVILSNVYDVDGMYKSMQGPHSTEEIHLDAKPPEEPELLWIVGFEAVMVSADGASPVSQEFMCHTNLDIDPTLHNALFDDDKPITGRLFTLSQGQYRIDMPTGFGIPILSHELLSLNTQVLNLNEKNPNRQVRHKVITRYVRDQDLKEPMAALFPAGAYGLKLLEGTDGHYGLDPKQAKAGGHEHHEHGGHHEHHAQGHQGKEPEHIACLPGENAGMNAVDDGKGRSFTGHWVVKPGREVNHTRVTELMALPFDTTLHYVAVHLHPFAESLTLRDLTANETIYTAKTRQADRGIGLAHVDFFSSATGIPLYKDHEYEIVSVYENTSDEPQDSMAVMNLYLHDKRFGKPDLAAVKKKLSEATGKDAPAKAM